MTKNLELLANTATQKKVPLLQIRITLLLLLSEVFNYLVINTDDILQAMN